MNRRIFYILGAATATCAIAAGWLNLTATDSAMVLKQAAPAGAAPSKHQRADVPFQRIIGKRYVRETGNPLAGSKSSPAPEDQLASLADQVATNWQNNQIRRTYGDLLTSMQLSSAQEQQFLALISSRCEGETAAEQDSTKQTEMALQQLLRDHWKSFAKYEEELEERIYVMQCDEVMVAHDAALSPDQRQRLIDVMVQEKERRRSSSPNAEDNSELALHDDLLPSASEMLEPHQLEVFKEALKQQSVADQLVRDAASTSAFEADLLPPVLFPPH